MLQVSCHLALLFLKRKKKKKAFFNPIVGKFAWEAKEAAYDTHTLSGSFLTH